jgi:sugar phosphate permease
VTTYDNAKKDSLDERFIDSSGHVSAAWRATLGTSLATAVGPATTTLTAFGVFVPYLRQAFGWEVGAISLAVTLLTISTAVITPLQGILVDRLGARRGILLSTPLYGLGYAAMSHLSGDIRMFYLMWVIMPILGFGIWPPAFVKTVSGWFDRRLGFAIGVSNIGIGLGQALIPIMIGAVASHYGWRMAYVAVGALSIFIALPCAYFYVFERGDRHRSELPPSDTVVRRALVAPGMTVRDSCSTATFWTLLISFVLLGGATTSVLVHQVSIAIDNGMAISAAIALQSLMGLSALIARVVVGWLLDRVAVNRVMPLLALSGAVAMVLYANGAVGATAVLCAVLMGLVVGSEFDVLIYALRRYFGPAKLGTLFGMLYATFLLGGAVSTAIVGVVRTHQGSFHASLYGLAAATVLMAILMSTLGAYRFVDARRAAVEVQGSPV